MEIGKEQPAIWVEPVTTPATTDTPTETPAPVEVPAEKEKVPA